MDSTVRPKPEPGPRASRGSQRPRGAPPATSGSFTLGAVLVMVMLFAGGASADGPIGRVIGQVAAAGLLALVLPSMHWGALWRQDRWAARLMLGLALLFVAHLFPLPPWAWTDLAGRSLFEQGDVMMFGLPQRRPLSLDPDATIAALVALLPAIATWLVLRQRPTLVPAWIGLFLGFLAVSLVLELAQTAAPGAFHLYANSQDRLPTGFFANRNHAAIAMACGIPLAAGLQRWLGVAALGGPQPRWLFPTAAVGCVVGALLTGSRSGAVLMLPGLLAGIAIAYDEQWRAALTPARRALTLRLLAGAVLLVVLLVVALVVLKPGGPLGQVLSRSLLADDPRYRFWPVTISLIAEYFPWGSGLGTFASAYTVVEPAEQLFPLIVNHAHNDWLEVVAETGLPGVALVIALLAWLVVRARACWGKGAAPHAPLAQAGVVAIGLLLAHSVYDYPLRTAAMSACFAACMAILSASNGEARAQVARRRSRG